MSAGLVKTITAKIKAAKLIDLYAGLVLLEKMRASDAGYSVEIADNGEFIYHFKKELSL
jgi:hypothetical protein